MEIVQELIRFVLGTISGLIAVNFFVAGIRTLRDPDYEIKRRVSILIRRYNRGEITREILERSCPEGSLRFGIVYDTKTGEFFSPAAMNRNF